MDKNARSYKKITLVLAIVLVVIAGGIAILLQVLNSNLLAEVGKDRIYREDLKPAVFAAINRGSLENPDNPTKDEKLSALSNLVNMKVLEKELEKENIQITEEDLSKAAKVKYENYNDRSEAEQRALKEYVRADVAMAKLKEKLVSWKEGYAIFCRFDRADQDDRKNLPESKKTKEGNKVYAENYCKKMKERLESGQTNFDTEVSNLSKNPILGTSGWKPYLVPFVEKFGKDTFTPLNFQFAYNEFEEIKKLGNKKGYSIIQVFDKNSVDSFYALVYLTGNGKDGVTTDFDKWFSDKKSATKIKIYEEKL